MITHDNPYKNNKLGYYCERICDYHLFGHCHDGEDDSLKGKFNCSILDDMYNRKKKFKCVIIDIKTMKDTAIREIMQILKASDLFTCPESNIIAEHNKKILALLESQLYVPIPEDEIPWDTSADVLESAIITDFND